MSSPTSITLQVLANTVGKENITVQTGKEEIKLVWFLDDITTTTQSSNEQAILSR